MPTCECGCGEETERTFVQGHDQRLRIRLEDRVGGLLSLRQLVDEVEIYVRGDRSSEELTRSVRRLLWRGDQVATRD